MDDLLRLTLDTCILTSAARSHSGPSYELLRLLYARRFVMLVSPALFLEYEAVLKRPQQRAAHGQSLLEIDLALLDLSELVEPVRIHFQHRPQLRDASDELVLECALNGSSDALVNYNVRDFQPAATHFGLEISTPESMIRKLRAYGHR